jgi:RND family efflux transporter MFP subunit
MSYLPVVLVAGLSLAGCQDKQVAGPDAVRPVKVMKAEVKPSSREVTYAGTVKARREASLGFRVAGKIVERCVNVGQHVEPGTLLARLDRTDLRLAMKSASASLAGATSQLAVAQSAYDRAAALFAKGFSTQASLDDRKLALDQARSSLDQARSSRDQAANQEAYAELKSDVAGTVTSVLAEAGQVVSSGTPVVVVARDGEKEVAVAIPESEIRFFKVGDRLAVRFWADPDRDQPGVAREIAGSADATSRTFAARVSLPDDPSIRLGETATVIADLPVVTNGIAVPLSALTERDGHPNLWIVDPTTKTVAPRAVTTASFADDGVRIASGLAQGDLVVTAGAQFMTPGKVVALASADGADASATTPQRSAQAAAQAIASTSLR